MAKTDCPTCRDSELPTGQRLELEVLGVDLEDGEILLGGDADDLLLRGSTGRRA